MTTPANPDTSNSVGATDDASKGGLLNTGSDTILNGINNAIAANAEAAQTAATNSAASASTASTQATNAANSATTASEKAATATTQAGIATTQANLATTNGAAQVTLATEQVTLATAAKVDSVAAKDLAVTAKNDSVTAKDLAVTAKNDSVTAKDLAVTAKNDSVAAKTAAESAQTAAEAAFDSFDDRYLGAKSSDPSVDNDGNSLITGALYFNSTSNNIKVYTGSAWTNAYVPSSDFAALSGADFTGAITAPSINLASTTLVNSILDEDNMASNSATALSTQQAIKSYVDTQVATVPVGDITAVTAGTGLSGGGTSGSVTLNIDGTVATLTGTQTLTNKTLGATSIAGNLTFTGAQTVDGRDVSVDGTKLDTIEEYATADQTGAEIKTAYESQANTNAYTDTDNAKVNHITVTQAVNLDQMEIDIAALENGMVYKGDWNASSGSFPGSGSAQIGWFYYVSGAGTVNGIAFAIGDNIVATTDNASTSTYASNWSKHDQTDAVQAVVGLTGSITKSGLLSALNVEDGANQTDTANVTAAGALMDSEVTNLAQVKAFDSSDYATAAQGTLATNALPKSGGAMTGAITTNSTFDGRNVSVDGAKLDGIEAGADVTDTTNVTAAGALMDSEVDADIKTLSLPANTTISAYGATLVDDATASAARTTLGLGTAATTASTDYATAAQGTTADAALPRTGGAMTGAITTNSTFDGRNVSVDGAKLDGIEAGATTDQTAAEIRALVESATDSNVFTDADHNKLNGIEAGATTDQTASEIRALVESATDSNVFTDADHTKLNGIEASADVTDAANVEPLVDAHLNTSTAASSEVLSWTGTDYDWVAQSAGGGADLYAANESSPSAQPSATGTNAIAIGEESIASGANSFAVNTQSASRGATGSNTIAMGDQAYAQGSYSVAIGRLARAGTSAAYSVAIGNEAYATGQYSVAIGFDATCLNNSYALAIGYDAYTVAGNYATAIGNSYAQGGSAFAANITNNTSSYGATGANSVAIGQLSKATQANSIAIGDTAISTTANQIALGGATDTIKISNTYTLPTADGSANQVLTTNGSGVVSFANAGGGADLYAANEVSVTAQPSATGDDAVAIGDSAVSSGANAIAFGFSSLASGFHAISIGNGESNNSNAIAIGGNSLSSGAQSFADGHSAVSTGSYSHACTNSYASGTYSFAAAIANNSSSYGATGNNSIAIGYRAKATGTGATSIGYLTQATAQETQAIGSNAHATGLRSSAFGYQAKTFSSPQYSIVLGPNSNANEDNTTALGYQAQASTVIGRHGYGNGYFAASGDSQHGLFILRSDTTDATAEALTTNNSTASTNNQLILPNNSAYSFLGTIIAREDATDGSDYASWEIKGALLRDANAASTVLGNGIQNKLYATAGASAWAIALTADTTNGGLKIEVTGAASTNIRWVATVHTSEVTYA